jgi:hypothetical protein
MASRGSGNANITYVRVQLLLLLTLLPLAAATRDLSYYDYEYDGDYFGEGYDYGEGNAPCPEDPLSEPDDIDTSGVCVGCSPVTPGSYPYFIAVSSITDPFGVHCGGTLITPDIVATAAHCMRRGMRAQV